VNPAAIFSGGRRPATVYNFERRACPPVHLFFTFGKDAAMKTFATFGLAVALLAASAATAEDTKFDAAKLEGTWTYVSGKKAGDDSAKEALAGTAIITKDTFTLKGTDPAMTFVIGYKLDTTKSPVAIDMDIKDGPVKEGKAIGIIQVKGDEITLCYVMGDKRPTKFESTKDNGAFLFVLKKKK
jgi:uncharacterized protein (TIGR03067 family)